MSPAPRLLWVGTNPGGGGTETHMISLCRALADAGVEMHVLVHPQGQIAQALHGSAVKLHYGRFRNSADPDGVAALWRALRQVRPQWVIGSFSKEYWPLALLSRAAGVPLLLFRHMDLRLRPSTRWLLSHWPLRLVAISTYLRERLVAQGLPQARVELLPNPLILAEFTRNEAARRQLRAGLGLDEGDFVLGFVGAWHRGKGVFVLADALDAAHAVDPRVNGLWLGGGAHETELRGRLAGRPGHHLLGWQQPVTPWYSAMDALALPSIEPDTFGRVCLEAQACGTPVLGAAMGGIPESFAADQTGLLLAPGDVEAWKDAFLHLTEDRQDLERLAGAGPEFARRFSAEKIAHEFLRVLGLTQ